MAVLRLLACGNFQQTAGDYIGVSQPTVCRILPEVCDAILEHFDIIAYMPRNQAECLAKASAFAGIAGMPRCIGAIDCTHVKIASPGGEVVSEIKEKVFFFPIHFFPERKLSQPAWLLLAQRSDYLRCSSSHHERCSEMARLGTRCNDFCELGRAASIRTRPI